MTRPDRDRQGRLPLHDAAVHGTLQDVEECLAAGNDIAAVDHQGITPLHLACQQGRADVVSVLLAHGAPVDPVDGWGNSPLWRAVFSTPRDPAIARRPLAAGADPDRRNGSGVSVRDLAERLGVTDLFG